MAHEVTLEIYSITVRKKFDRNSESLLPLDNLSGNDFLQFAARFCDDFSVEMDIDETHKRSFQVKKDSLVVDAGARTIRGLIANGIFGIGSNIVGKDGTLKYPKTAEDVDEKPFYFMMHIPKNSNIGILMLQRFGGDGFFTNFKTNFKKFFQTQIADHTLDIETLITKKLYRTLLKYGEAKAIVLRRYKLPKDVTDSLGGLDFKESVSHAELKIVAKGVFNSTVVKAIKDALDNNETRLLTSKSLDSMGFDENAKQFVFVKSGKSSSRKIDLSDHMKIRPYYDIDEKVTKDRNGHPTFESIDAEAVRLLNEIMEDIGKK